MTNTSTEMDRLLHRYVDGDLSAEERETVERELARSEIARRKLAALGDVRTLVRGAADAELSEADSASMWAAIERGAGLEASPAKSDSRPALRLVGGTSAGAPNASSSPAEKTSQKIAPSAPVEDELTRRRRRVAVAIGAFALAAAAVFAIFRPGDPSAPTQLATSDETQTPESDGPPDSMRTEVLAVDFGTNVGTIFAVEGTEGQRYAVVWLDDAVKIDEGGASPDETSTPD